MPEAVASSAVARAVLKAKSTSQLAASPSGMGKMVHMPRLHKPGHDVDPISASTRQPVNPPSYQFRPPIEYERLLFYPSGMPGLYSQLTQIMSLHVIANLGPNNIAAGALLRTRQFGLIPLGAVW